MRVLRVVTLIAGALGLSACLSAGTPPSLSANELPPRFDNRGPESAPVWPAREWWRGFESAELDALIDAAERGNLNLAAAEARVIEADARIRQAGAALLPFAGVSGGANRSFSPNSESFNAGLGVSYELDLWNRNRNNLIATAAAGNATRADRQTVALTAISGVASTYFQLRSLRERLGIARLNLDTALNVLMVTEARVRNGFATPLELAQQRAAIAGQQAQIPLIEQQELEARSALALLLGRPPEGFDVAGSELISLAFPEVAPGLPSDLLQRRPDIAAVEFDLAAAHADIAVARAAYFPQISLTANGGLRSARLADLVANPASTLSVGASLVQTVFDAGRIGAITVEARAREQEILANYRAVANTAFAEVENALGAIAHYTEREQFLAEQVVQSQAAFDIATARYREGIADYLTVLDAQRTLYGARDARSQVRLLRLLATVGLYKALGGGWQNSASAIAL